MSILPGQAQGHLGRYELLARLATGGMGEIFLARLEGAAGFEKLYVLKRVLPHLADDGRFRTMLIDEARIAAKMSHPNICQVYELGEDGGQLFIAMEYLEGVTLLPILRRAAKAGQPLDVGLVVGVLQQTCDALHYAHELVERDGTRLSVVHRDVTPSNLFVTENGIIKVLDFGIAKAKDASAHTQDGTVKGKYAYMAPEQLRSEPIDRRVDVFALGVVGFEMLALRRLFQRKTDYLTFRAVMELPIPNVLEFRPDLPGEVAAVISRALDRDARGRFDTARQFAAALQDAIDGHTRAWSTSEIGDYVRHNFADELRRRGSALSSVIISRDATTVAGRTTMPVLDPIDHAAGETDDDDDFPSIDTGVHVIDHITKLERTERAAARTGSASDALGAPLTELAPAPELADGRTRAAKGGARPTRETVALPRIEPRRSLFWPVFAVGVVAAGAVALWFMWKQIKSQSGIVIVEKGNAETLRSGGEGPTPPPGPGSGGVAVGSAEPGPGPGSNAAGGGPGSNAGSDPGSGVVVGPGSATRPGDRPRPPGTGPRIPKSDQEIIKHVQTRLGAISGSINDCVDEHRGSVPVKPTGIVLTVRPNGRAKATVEPAAVNTSALGGCIRKAAEGIDYGTLAREATLKVPLHPK